MHTIITDGMNRDMQALITTTTEAATNIVRSKYDETDAGTNDIIALITRQNEKTNESGDDLHFETMRDQVMMFLGAGHDASHRHRLDIESAFDPSDHLATPPRRNQPAFPSTIRSCSARSSCRNCARHRCGSASVPESCLPRIFEIYDPPSC